MRTAQYEKHALSHYKDPALYDVEYVHDNDVKFYRKLVKKLGEGRVLEVGCGTGRVTIPLARDGVEVVGVDASKEMLARCEEKVKELPTRLQELVTLIPADMRQIGEGMKEGSQLDASFPLAILPFGVLSHAYTLEDMERTLAGLKKCLAKDGYIAFDLINPAAGWIQSSPKLVGKRQMVHPKTGAGFTSTNEISYNAELQIATIKIEYHAVKKGRKKDTEVKVPKPQVLPLRQWYTAEVKEMLHYNGFEVREVYGGWNKEKLSLLSGDQIFVAQRKP